MDLSFPYKSLFLNDTHFAGPSSKSAELPLTNYHPLFLLIEYYYISKQLE